MDRARPDPRVRHHKEPSVPDQNNVISGNQYEQVAGNSTCSVGGDQSVQVGRNVVERVVAHKNLNVGKTLYITAGDEVVIVVGAASLTMKKDGTIVLKGKDITLDASGKVNVKASGDLVMKGNKVLQN